MPTVSRDFVVSAPPSQVLTYLKDFGNAEQWDPGTQRCDRMDTGPVQVGSRWRNTSRILGRSTELDYVLREATDDTLVFEGRNDASTSVDTIVVTEVPGGARINYRADLRMHGLAVLLAPAMKLVFEKLATDTEKQMTRVLNDLAA